MLILVNLINISIISITRTKLLASKSRNASELASFQFSVGTTELFGFDLGPIRLIPGHESYTVTDFNTF